MKRFQHILIPLTGSPADQSALKWARLIAERAGTARIQALILDPEPADWVPEYPPVKGYEPWKDRVQRAAEELSATFEGLPGLKLNTTSAVGAPLPTILNELVDANCDLVVIGHADEGERRLAEKLARKSPASVLSVPEAASDSCGSILVPIDFSEPSALALETALAFGHSFESRRVSCLHSFRISKDANRAGVSLESLRAAYQQSAAERLSGFLGGLSLDSQQVQSIIREAPVPSAAILDELAENSYDLLVIATRGRNSILRALLGSNTADVIRSARSPVLAVKPKGEGLQFLRDFLGSRNADLTNNVQPS